MENYSVLKTEVKIVKVETVDKDILILRNDEKNNHHYVLDIYANGLCRRSGFTFFELIAIRKAINLMMGDEKQSEDGV